MRYMVMREFTFQVNKLRNKMPNIKIKTVLYLNNIAVLQIWRAFYIFTFTHFKMTMIFTKS